jgi:hypothetical protein
VERPTTTRISTRARDKNDEESVSLACGYASFLVPQLRHDGKSVQRFIEVRC